MISDGPESSSARTLSVEMPARRSRPATGTGRDRAPQGRRKLMLTGPADALEVTS